jgi:hypothetical protein
MLLLLLLLLVLLMLLMLLLVNPTAIWMWKVLLLWVYLMGLEHFWWGVEGGGR